MSANLNHDKVVEAGEIARLISYFIILFSAIGLFFTADKIPTSRFETLGAGAFPKIVSLAIAVVTIIAIIGALRNISSSSYREFFIQAGIWIRKCHLVFIILAALALYVLVMPFIGFSIASMVFIFLIQVLLMNINKNSIVIALITAVVFSFGLNWLFAEVFNVFLPRGKL